MRLVESNKVDNNIISNLLEEEAKADLEVITVDGEEFSYDDDSNFTESVKLTESTKDIKSLAKSVEDILKQCGAKISYVDYSESIKNPKIHAYKLHEYNTINLSCEVGPDKISKTENDVGIYGTLKFDNDLNLIEAELRTSSGPNVLNYNFIKCLDALYSYFSSGNNHYNM